MGLAEDLSTDEIVTLGHLLSKLIAMSTDERDRLVPRPYGLLTKAGTSTMSLGISLTLPLTMNIQ